MKHTHAEQKGIFLAEVRANQPLCREHGHLVLKAPDFPPAEPGQFVQILCRDPRDGEVLAEPMLRRPFSIGGLRRRGKSCELDIMYRVVGVGSRWLAQQEPGATVSILGPLGRPFSILQDRPIAYLVGGGIGLPPLIWLAEALRAAGQEILAFCGSRTADLLPLTRWPKVKIAADRPTLAAAQFAAYGVPVIISTDDGSLGAAGPIAAAFARHLEAHPDQAARAALYTCGPRAMMHAVARLCAQYAIPCQVCLESMMACGMSTCQSCVVKVRDEAGQHGWSYRLCCSDGPVFDGSVVLWEA